MILVAIVVLAIVLVPLTGGRLGALLEIRLRSPWLLVLALAMQVTLQLLPGPTTWWRVSLYVATFPIGLFWIWRNRVVTGLWIAAAGAVLNGIAILANGGVMPTSASALRTAGMLPHRELFANSSVVDNARLAFLGDVFAIPASWPLANVFSAGDILIALGAAVAIHAVCGSRLVPSRWRRRQAVATPSGLPSDRDR